MGRKQSKTLKNQGLMKIAKLSSVSGVNKSTIHHYLKIGLLPEPVRAGLNLHLYNETHLSRLLKIRNLRESKGLSLQKIKVILAEENESDPSFKSPNIQIEKYNSRSFDVKTSGKKIRSSKQQQIIDVATELFCQKGFEGVRISDIADALQMGKATLYEYFQTKEELFMECIERLSLIVLPRERWEEINKESDIFRRFEKRAMGFLEAFKDYEGILNLARTASYKSDLKIAKKGKDAIRLMTLPMREELDKAQAEGKVRRVDSELVSYFLLALGESLGFRIAMDEKYSIEEGLKTFMDFIRKALEI